MYKVLAAAVILSMFISGCEQGLFSMGNDESFWANDGECDDPRFFGPGMATSLDRDDEGRDASDCRALLASGQVSIWDQEQARAATSCPAIDFGNNQSTWANDGLCDDIRFWGSNSDGILLPEDTGRDATDCRQACQAGTVFLRNY